MKSQIEKIVTSLEVSRKLKDLGIIQESCFYWARSGGPWHVKIADTNMLRCARNGNNYLISAWTVTELGAMLSRDINHTVPDNSAGLLLRLIDGIKKDHQLNDCDFKEVVEGWNENLKKWREG